MKNNKILVMGICIITTSSQLCFASASEQIDNSVNRSDICENNSSVKFSERILKIFKEAGREEGYLKALKEKKEQMKNPTVNHEIDKPLHIEKQNNLVEKNTNKLKKEKGVWGFFENLFLSARNGIGNLFGYHYNDKSVEEKIEEHKKSMEGKSIEEQIELLNEVPQINNVPNNQDNQEIYPNETKKHGFKSQPMNIDEYKEQINPNTALFEEGPERKNPPQKMLLKWYMS